MGEEPNHTVARKAGPLSIIKYSLTGIHKYHEDKTATTGIKHIYAVDFSI